MLISDTPGECKHLIQSYLKCLKLQRGVNDEECRKLAKGYLACRMDKYVSLDVILCVVMCGFETNRSFSDRNLMAPDDFSNLGLVFEGDKHDRQNEGSNPRTGPGSGTQTGSGSSS